MNGWGPDTLRVGSTQWKTESFVCIVWISFQRRGTLVIVAASVWTQMRWREDLCTEARSVPKSPSNTGDCSAGKEWAPHPIDCPDLSNCPVVKYICTGAVVHSTCSFAHSTCEFDRWRNIVNIIRLVPVESREHIREKRVRPGQTYRRDSRIEEWDRVPRSCQHRTRKSCSPFD